MGEPLTQPEPGLGADLRTRINAALSESIDRCARCKVCDTQVDAVMAALSAGDGLGAARDRATWENQAWRRGMEHAARLAEQHANLLERIGARPERVAAVLEVAGLLREAAREGGGT